MSCGRSWSSTAMPAAICGSGIASTAPPTPSPRRTAAARTRRSSSIPPVRPADPRACCTRSASCSDICRGSNCRMSFFRSRATCSGRRPIGHGSAGCSTCCCPAFITAYRSWPTALKMMRQVSASRARFAHRLRSVGSGGEALGEEVLEWGRAALGVDINEFYGQTEANLVVGNCASLFAIRPGSMGRAIPGHGVAVVSADGRPLPPGESGIVAVRRPDPVLFLGYWNDPEASRAKFAGEWLLTGDIAIADEDGYFWYKGREDDLISSGGYRIGPTDIEECLGKHPVVVMAAVVGRPDPVRGEIVKAFVVPR